MIQKADPSRRSARAVSLLDFDTARTGGFTPLGIERANPGLALADVHGEDYLAGWLGSRRAGSVA